MLSILLSLVAIDALSPTAPWGGSARATAPIKPSPDRARQARGPLPAEGCFLSPGETRSPRCVYGVPDSNRRVVLFGDSHAMHFFPGLRPLLRERNWRLVVLTKAGCPPMLAVKRAASGEPTDCSIWRRRALRRIESRPPDMIIAGGSVNYRLVDSRGEALEEEDRQARLASSYREVLRRLGRTGARTVVMKDVPMAPFDVPECVAEFIDQPRECDFDLPAGHARNFDTRAARKTGAKLVDVTGTICAEQRCRSVVRHRLVYRGGSHLTAPFARILRDRLALALPRIR